MSDILTINLSAMQAEQWNWAQAAAEEYWSDDESRDDGLHFDKSPVGPCVNGSAIIKNHPDVIEDMLYRLGEQLQGMCGDEGGIYKDGTADNERMAAMRISKAAKQVCEKIEMAVQ
jgi:hypothetical protein